MASKVSQSITITNICKNLPVSSEATTSRVVVDNELLRVVYFSFDKGQELTTHSSDRAVVVTLLSGSMDFTVSGKLSKLAPGDCIYLAPEEPHSLVATEACHLQLVLVDMSCTTLKQ